MGLDSTREYPIVTVDGFSYGLRCSYCDRIIDNGFPYGGTIIGFTSGQEPVYELSCVYCPSLEEGETDEF